MEGPNPAHGDASHVASTLENVVISSEDESKASISQSSFFRAIEEANIQLLHILLKKGSISVDAFNEQGMTALHLAVYKFETRRNLDILEILLEHGANPCLKAASPPKATKLSLVRHDSKGHSESSIETKKISLDQKTPLLLALELKSVLYLRGWEYRHWDSVLKLLSGATLKTLSHLGVDKQTPDTQEFVKKGWKNVFETGNHSIVEVSAEGKGINALRLLLAGASKKLKLNLEALAIRNSNVLELKDVSFSIAKELVKFIYTGSVTPDFLEHRGIDLLQAAHKYGVDVLVKLCEVEIQPTQENWIKLLTAAEEVESDFLVFKCAKSIEDVMVRRHEGAHILKRHFSEASHDSTPHQLFHHDPYA